MTEFLKLLKADLLDRRLLPFVALIGVGLVAALSYAVLAGGPSASRETVTSVPPSATGVAVSAAPTNADQAVAETTSGAFAQRGGNTHDPFSPLSGAAAVASSTSPASPSTASSTKSSSSSGSNSPTTPSSGSGGAKGESSTPVPSKPTKHTVVVHYVVTAQFGVVPPPPPSGAPAAAPQLKTYAKLTVNEPIPAKSNPQLVFLGVVLRTGKDAVFALTGESILHGGATCMPSATHCQAIELQPGQTEQLESFEANGTPVTYELRLVSIARSVGSASAARASSVSQAELRTGRELLRRAGLNMLPGLRYSQAQDLLVPVSGAAFAVGARG